MPDENGFNVARLQLLLMTSNGATFLELASVLDAREIVDWLVTNGYVMYESSKYVPYHLTEAGKFAVETALASLNQS